MFRFDLLTYVGTVLRGEGRDGLGFLMGFGMGRGGVAVFLL